MKCYNKLVFFGLSITAIVLFLSSCAEQKGKLTQTKITNEELEEHFQNIIKLSEQAENDNSEQKLQLRNKEELEYLQIYNAEESGIAFVLTKLQNGNLIEKRLAALSIRRIITAEEGWLEYQYKVTRNAHYSFCQGTIEKLNVLFLSLSPDDIILNFHICQILSHLFYYDLNGPEYDLFIKWWEKCRETFSPYITYYFDSEDETVQMPAGMEKAVTECQSWWSQNKHLYPGSKTE